MLIPIKVAMISARAMVLDMQILIFCGFQTKVEYHTNAKHIFVSFK